MTCVGSALAGCCDLRSPSAFSIVQAERESLEPPFKSRWTLPCGEQQYWSSLESSPEKFVVPWWNQQRTPPGGGIRGIIQGDLETLYTFAKKLNQITEKSPIGFHRRNQEHYCWKKENTIMPDHPWPLSAPDPPVWDFHWRIFYTPTFLFLFWRVSGHFSSQGLLLSPMPVTGPQRKGNWIPTPGFLRGYDYGWVFVFTTAH